MSEGSQHSNKAESYNVAWNVYVTLKYCLIYPSEWVHKN